MPSRKYIIIADECVGLDWVGFLREGGYAVISFSTRQRKGKSDDEVLREVIKRRGILLTGDAEFARRASQIVPAIHVKPRSVQQSPSAANTLLTTLEQLTSEQKLSPGLWQV